MSITHLKTINSWTDFWYHEIGVNIIPSNTRKKIPLIGWQQYQNKSIPESLFERWKIEGRFTKGIAIILGKIWRGKYKGYYLNGIDLDNQKAIEEICNYKGKRISLEELAKWTIVEQHSDNPDKAHVYVISPRPFKKKSSDKVKADLIERDIPAIEVKGDGEHGIFFCTPSTHKNGHPYRIIGTKDLALSEDFEEHIDTILKKYDISYLDKENQVNRKSQVLIEELFKPDFKVLEGHNRHEALLRIVESLLSRNKGILSLNQIEELASEWNMKHCVPPLNNREFEKQMKCALDFIASKDQEKKEQGQIMRTGGVSNGGEMIIPVSRAIRLHSGIVKVQGTISSVSELYKLIKSLEVSCMECEYINTVELAKPVIQLNQKGTPNCPNCNGGVVTKPLQFANAVTVELRDSESFNDLDKLSVILLDNDTEGIRAGEKSTVIGEIDLIQKKSNWKTYPVIYAQSVKYEYKEELGFTQQDIEAIKRFRDRNRDSIIEKLISLTINSVIGHVDIKEGLLLSAVNCNADKSHQRGRIHVLIVGPPGLAKTEMLNEITKLVPGSVVESGQNSSGLSLTAMVAKEEETYMLRLGPVPRATNAICAINEINRMDYKNQQHFLDTMEEGYFTLNKYGINAKINSHTTIIASANPAKSPLAELDVIDPDEFIMLEPLLDRFDLIFVLRRPKGHEVMELGYRISENEDKIIPDYSTFIKKYVKYAQKLEPNLTEEAKSILTEYYVKLADEYGTPRLIKTLFRLTKARARLKLKVVADEVDARETLEFYNKMLNRYRKTITIPGNPREVTCRTFIDILKQSKAKGFVVKELCKIASEKDKQIENYLGPIWQVEHNHKLKSVIEMLRVSEFIMIISKNPLTFQYSHDRESDASDASDPSKRKYNRSLVPTSGIRSIELMSDVSALSDSKLTETETKVISSINERNEVDNQSIRNKIYRIRPRSDIWACPDCKYTGDIWFMQGHPCKITK